MQNTSNRRRGSVVVSLFDPFRNHGFGYGFDFKLWKSTSGSVLSSEALSSYAKAKHVQLSRANLA